MVELESLLRPASRSLLRVPNDRRGRDRVPLVMPCDEYVGDRLHRVLTTDVSPSGMFVDRVFGAGLDRLQLGREERTVQLELTLPETTDSIWAHAEICHDRVGTLRGPRTSVHGTGVRFLAMARQHERLLEDFVHEHRKRSLEKLLERVLERRGAGRDRRGRDRRTV